jgi:FkbM family methyltransferase
MRLLYHPAVNRLARTVLRPLAPVIPEGLQFPVTGTISIRLPGGKRIRLAANPTSFVAKRLYWNGFEGYEPDVMRVFIPLVQRATVFLDVGANIGLFSLVAGAFRPDLRIAGFEPLPAAHRYLERNLRLNGLANAVAENLAISDVAGSASFRAPHNPKFHFVADKLTSTGGLAAEDPGETITVQTDTLDAYVARKSLERVDLIKLDTEANEHRVLAGAGRVLAEHRPIILCEVLPGRVERQIQDQIAGHGFRLFRIGPHGLAPVEDLRHGEEESNDHLFVPGERVGEVGGLLTD